MTLILKPRGKGNWSPLIVVIEGQRAAPILVRRGQLIPLGGVTYRIVEVKP